MRGNMAYQDRIVRNKAILNGRPVIKGTRIPISVIMSHLEAEDPIELILEEFPALTIEDVRAVIAFAMAAARDDEPLVELEAG